ncbi:FMN-binding protein [Candidatus Omnitrophota bacterium]
MRNTLKMIIVLTAVGLISGATLVFTYKYASPLIKNNKRKEIESAIFSIYPSAKNYDKKTVHEKMIFEVKDGSGKLLGYAFLAKGNGYQGTIKLMAGISTDFKTVKGIEILESQETPGLGQEIASDKFRSQFKGLKTEPEITYIKNKKPEKRNEIQAVTGATISSRAVVSILNETIDKLKPKK